MGGETSDTTRPSLLRRLREPDHVEQWRDAWREFEQRYARLIVRYAQSRGLQRMDAEDVRQSVYMKLQVALRAFDYDPGRGRFRDYLGRVVHNAVNSHLHRPIDEPAGVHPDGLLRTAAADAHAEAWEREWRLHHFHLAMKTIRRTFDPRSLEMFDRMLAGEDPVHVAAALGTTRDAVYKVKQRIRERLKERVQQQINDEELPEREPTR